MMPRGGYCTIRLMKAAYKFALNRRVKQAIQAYYADPGHDERLLAKAFWLFEQQYDRHEARA